MLPLFHAVTRNPEDQGGNADGSRRNLNASYYMNVPIISYLFLKHASLMDKM